MNQNTTRVSPRGFIYVYENGGKVADTNRPDMELQALFNRFRQHEVTPSAWPFRKQVMTVAMRLLTPFPSWVAAQYQNPYLYGRNFEFFEDTLRYLQTGRRRMEPMNWIELMDERPSDRPHLSRRPVNQALMPRVKMAAKSQDILSLAWCARPGGFDDLLHSLYVMYGKAITEAPE